MSEKPARIFIVDDHPLVREALVALVGRQQGRSVRVQAHREQIKRKLGVPGTSQLVREAVHIFEHELRAQSPPGTS